MSRATPGPHQLTPEILIRAYAAGIFPMSESRDDPSIFWVDPELRGVLPLDTFHVPRSLKKVIRHGLFDVSVDTDFSRVINACAETPREDQGTWINDQIIDAYTALHHLGLAHSIECRQDGVLVGGLYGVSLKGAFCGESMFSHVPNASKVALVHLVARLRYAGFVVLDTQFITPHLTRFGAIEIPARHYLEKLDAALTCDADFPIGINEEQLKDAIEDALNG